MNIYPHCNRTPIYDLDMQRFVFVLLSWNNSLDNTNHTEWANTDSKRKKHVYMSILKIHKWLVRLEMLHIYKFPILNIINTGILYALNIIFFTTYIWCHVLCVRVKIRDNHGLPRFKSYKSTTNISSIFYILFLEIYLQFNKRHK